MRLHHVLLLCALAACGMSTDDRGPGPGGGAPDGIDTIYGIESFQFADATLSVSELTFARTGTGGSSSFAP